MNRLMLILERLNLNTKLNLGFGVVIVFLFLSGMQGIYSQYRLNESTNKMASNCSPFQILKQPIPT